MRLLTVKIVTSNIDVEGSCVLEVIRRSLKLASPSGIAKEDVRSSASAVTAA